MNNTRFKGGPINPKFTTPPEKKQHILIELVEGTNVIKRLTVAMHPTCEEAFSYEWYGMHKDSHLWMLNPLGEVFRIYHKKDFYRVTQLNDNDANLLKAIIQKTTSIMSQTCYINEHSTTKKSLWESVALDKDN